MRLTLRRRALIAVLVSWPLGYYYLDFSFFTGINMFRDWRTGIVGCTGRWEEYVNSCNPQGYSSTLALVELFVTTAVAVLIVYGLARWVAQPVRQVADSVSRFGPNALGLRLRASGPRDETRQLADSIDGMLDRLAEGYEAQRRFASTASHELRTPLATQRALIEVSLSSALTEDQLALLTRQLLATNERNERLVDGLLTLAETERGLMANTPLRLDRIVAESVELYRSTAKEREVEIGTALEPVTVLGEEPLLDRLVSNLVQNAIKYNRPNGVVQVRLHASGELTVSNTGPMVAPELVPGLFEPFRRLSGERLDSSSGVGLGLTIARSIVAAHRGSVTASANPEGGLTVTVRLPPAG